MLSFSMMYALHAIAAQYRPMYRTCQENHVSNHGYSRVSLAASAKLIASDWASTLAFSFSRLYCSERWLMSLPFSTPQDSRLTNHRPVSPGEFPKGSAHQRVPQ